MYQHVYDDLSTVPYIDKHWRAIPNHPELLGEMRAQLPVPYLLQKKRRKSRLKTTPKTTSHGIHKCRGNQRPSTTTFEDERPNCILSVTTKWPPARIDTAEPDNALKRLPAPCQQQADALIVINRNGTANAPIDSAWPESFTAGSEL